MCGVIFIKTNNNMKGTSNDFSRHPKHYRQCTCKVFSRLAYRTVISAFWYKLSLNN